MITICTLVFLTFSSFPHVSGGIQVMNYLFDICLLFDAIKCFVIVMVLFFI